MRNTVHHEWAVEYFDQHQDIHDTHHLQSLNKDTVHLADLYHVDTETDLNRRLVLIRDEGNDNEGLVHRSWAYVTLIQGRPYLSEKYGEPDEDGEYRPTHDIPKKLRAEFEKWRGNFT